MFVSNLAFLDSSLFIQSCLCLESLPSALDCGSFGMPLFLQSSVCSGPFLLLLFYVRLERIISLQSFGYPEATPFVSNYVSFEALSLSRSIFRQDSFLFVFDSLCPDLALSPRSVAKAGFAVSPADFAKPGVSMSSQNLERADILVSSLGRIWPEFLMLICDFATLGFLLLPRSFAQLELFVLASHFTHLESTLLPQGLSRLNSPVFFCSTGHLNASFVVLDFACLDLLLSQQGLHHPGLGLFVLTTVRSEVLLFIPDSALAGSSLLPRSFARLDLSLLAMTKVQTGFGALFALDFLHLGTLLFLHSLSRIEPSMFALDFLHPEPSLLMQSILHPGSTLSLTSRCLEPKLLALDLSSSETSLPLKGALARLDAFSPAGGMV